MKRTVFSVALVLGLMGVAGCKSEPPPPPPPTPAPKPKDVEIDAARLQLFKPLPAVMESADNPITEEKVVLGRMLYFDARLSKNHDISCNTCHNLEQFGVDNKPTSPGHKGQLGTRNSPTVYNAAGHIAQFWDGREATVEAQASKPIGNPVEMAVTENKRLLKTLNSIPEYVDAFKKAFPEAKDAVTVANLEKAIGAFERKLTTPSRWDKFLAGDTTALTNEEKTGFNAFIDAGCNACHMGEYMGGNMFQKLGLVKPWPTPVADQGKFDVTKQEADRLMFKVPSLRNVEKTGPWMHDGSIGTLEEMVKLMAAHQSGKELTDKDVASIVTFLKTLTGEIPKDFIAQPTLPPSGKNTPKPDPS